MLCASLILAPLIYKNLKIQKNDLPSFVWAALTGVTLNLTFFFIGIKLTEAILAAFLVASVPIFTMVAAHFYLKEKLTLRLILASIIAILGVFIIIGKLGAGLDLRQFLGNLFLLAATLFWVAHEIISKKLLKKYEASTVTFYAMAIGAVSFFPLFLTELVKNPFWFAGVDASGIGGLLYGIFFASLIAYWAWHKGLALLPAGQASFFFYLDPISGSILSIILLGEKITPQLIVGGLFIIIGVLLAEQHRKSHPLHQQTKL